MSWYTRRLVIGENPPPKKRVALNFTSRAHGNPRKGKIRVMPQVSSLRMASIVMRNG